MSDGMLDREQRGHVEVLTVRQAEVVQAEIIERLGHTIRKAIDLSDAACFVLDLSAVRFMTSGALGLIIHLHAQLAERDRAFVLAAATDDVASALQRARLAEVLPVYATVEEAVRDQACPPPGDS
ncbi:MAG TPA: STAS domain-containing protein [Phycisphaerae bacterium]|nr:STAS domain-containing protein [Phycisphaerae bacterium]